MSESLNAANTNKHHPRSRGRKVGVRARLTYSHTHSLAHTHSSDRISIKIIYISVFFVRKVNVLIITPRSKGNATYTNTCVVRTWMRMHCALRIHIRHVRRAYVYGASEWRTHMMCTDMGYVHAKMHTCENTCIWVSAISLLGVMHIINVGSNPV